MLMEIDANKIFAHCRCKNNLHTKHCILPTLGIAPFPTQLSLLEYKNLLHPSYIIQSLTTRYPSIGNCYYMLE